MEQLKPCPFCGSKKVEVRQIKNVWSVGCATTNFLCQWWFMRQFTDKEQSIEKWNGRPDSEDYIPNAEKRLLESYGIKER